MLINWLEVLIINKMSQDIVADAINKIMNAKRAGKKEVIINIYSKLLIDIFEVAKKGGYIENYKKDGTKLVVKIGKLNECKAIKPRFYVKKDGIDKYVRRYLPSRKIGIIIISTNQGLLTQHQAEQENIGGSLIAYFF